jgi:hypothetical protein
VAAELGVTKNAVIQAKSRILKRLRSESGEILEEMTPFRGRSGDPLAFH